MSSSCSIWWFEGVCFSVGSRCFSVCSGCLDCSVSLLVRWCMVMLLLFGVVSIGFIMVVVLFMWFWCSVSCMIRFCSVVSVGLSLSMWWNVCLVKVSMFLFR